MNILVTTLSQPSSLLALILFCSHLLFKCVHLSFHLLSSFLLCWLSQTTMPPDAPAPTHPTPQWGAVDSVSDFIRLQAEGSKRRSRPDWWTQGATDRWQAARPQSDPPRGAKVLARLPQPHLWLDDGAPRWVQPQFALPSAWHGSARTVTLLTAWLHPELIPKLPSEAQPHTVAGFMSLLSVLTGLRDKVLSDICMAASQFLSLGG